MSFSEVEAYLHKNDQYGHFYRVRIMFGCSSLTAAPGDINASWIYVAFNALLACSNPNTYQQDSVNMLQYICPAEKNVPPYLYSVLIYYLLAYLVYLYESWEYFNGCIQV